MVLKKMAGVLSELKNKIDFLWIREQTWLQFKLVVTNPPRYSGHFDLIKKELVPFVERHSLSFWVTNYWSTTEDFILFRVKGTEHQTKSVRNFVQTLKKKRLIVDWESSTWNPGTDAQNRIEGLRQIRNFDPNRSIITGYDPMNSRFLVLPDVNFQERQAQLTALFESVGECTRAIYSHLSSKPKDLWEISLFVHLVLNSLDFSGPDQPSEEYSIRSIPPV
jgi:hypothetical protein